MAILKNTNIEGTDAVTLPVGTSSNRPPSPVENMIRFNTDINSIEIYKNSVWETINTQETLGSINNPAGSAKDLWNFGLRTSGLYYLQNNKINNGDPFQAYCDLQGHDGNDGGWTLVHTVAGSDSNWSTSNIGLRNELSPTTSDDYSIIDWVDYIKAVDDNGNWEFAIGAGDNLSTFYQWGGTFWAGPDDRFVDGTPRTGKFRRNVDFTGARFGNDNMYERVPWINPGAYSPTQALFTTYPGTPNWWGTITEGGSSTQYTTGPWLNPGASATPAYKWVFVR